MMPPLWAARLAVFGRFTIMMAMAAIRLNTHLRQLVTLGRRSTLLGFGCWTAVTLISIMTLLLLI